VEFEALRKFGNPEFVGFPEKLLENVKRMRDGLDNIVGLIPAHH
jgi:hypothetical protein